MSGCTDAVGNGSAVLQDGQVSAKSTPNMILFSFVQISIYSLYNCGKLAGGTFTMHTAQVEYRQLMSLPTIDQDLVGWNGVSSSPATPEGRRD